MIGITAQAVGYVTSDPVIRKCTVSIFIAQSVRVDDVDGSKPHA